MPNQLLPFLLPRRGVRGFAVDITEGIPELLGARDYPPDVARLLGQMLAATPLLAADLRSETRMNLQFQGKKDLKLLVTQIDQELNLRGMAECAAIAEGDFQALMGGGLLACVMDPRGGAQQYQAVVEILGYTLAEAIELYFHRSEQLPTLMRLGASAGRFTGLMLQKLPEGEAPRIASYAREGTERPAMDGLEDSFDDHWETVKALFGTLGEGELLSADPVTLLNRLFPEDEVRVMQARAITLACRCSHAGISAMLLGLGEDELRPVLQERGKVEVTCEFCGRTYSYADVEVRNLFAGASDTPQGGIKLN